MKFFIMAVTLAALSALSACNTMEGLGQDMQKGGQKVEDAAERNK